MPGSSPWLAVRHRLGALRALSGLTPEERTALLTLARTYAEEHVRPMRSPTISPLAHVSPLASIRFAERVAIGDRASIGPWCVVWGGWSRTWARVGEGALLSPGVVLVAGNHGTEGTGPVRDQPFTELDVEVGPGAWVGAHSIVVGCRVGTGAVIGAGSVVTRDVPDFAVAVGAPARVVGTREDDT